MNNEYSKIVLDFSLSRNRTYWHWSKICKRRKL